MTEHDRSVSESVQPKVRRVDRGDESFTSASRAQLTRRLEESWPARDEASARMADLAKQALRPIQQLVERDAAANAAWGELQRERLGLLERYVRSRGVARTFTGPPLPSLIPVLHAGVNVFAPPYDFQLTGPTKGPVTSSADRLSGTFSVLLPWGHGGARFATAGVGLTLQAGATGVVHVRPAWHYDFRASAQGSWLLGSHTEGAGKVVVQEAVTGTILKDQTAPLWNFVDDHTEEQDGYIASWTLGVDVFVQAGQLFTVSFLATAMVDDSGPGFFGSSLAAVTMEMSVAFVVVELGP